MSLVEFNQTLQPKVVIGRGNDGIRGLQLKSLESWSVTSKSWIFKEEGNFTVVDDAHCQRCCWVCLQEVEKRLECLKCKKAIYCGPRCKDADKFHVHECRKWAEGTFVPASVRLLLKIIVDRLDSTEQDWWVWDLETRLEKDHESDHFEKIVLLSSLLTEEFQDKLEKSLPPPGKPIPFDKENAKTTTTMTMSRFILLLFSALQQNGLVVHAADLEPVGVTILPLGRLVNHSCVPNIAFMYEFQTGKCPKAVARCLQPLTEKSGARVSLTTSYIDITEDTESRRRALNLYGFQCNCSKCNTPDATEKSRCKDIQTLKNSTTNLISSRKFTEAYKQSVFLYRQLSQQLLPLTIHPILTVNAFKTAKLAANVPGSDKVDKYGQPLSIEAKQFAHWIQVTLSNVEATHGADSHFKKRILRDFGMI